MHPDEKDPSVVLGAADGASEGGVQVSRSRTVQKEAGTSSGRRGVSGGKAASSLGCGGCLALAATVAVLALVVAGWIAARSLGAFTDSVEADLRQNPVIIEHIGRIESFDLELRASVVEPGEDAFVFRVEGTRGAGLVHATCITVEGGSQNVIAGRLQMEGDEAVDLFPARHDTLILSQ